MKTRDFIYLSKTTKIMKTGGTLNFLKRAGAILMLLAIFASSCNKYADDFKQLNTKLDALATQVAGVTQLSTDVAALKSQITSLASAVSALPNPTASIAALATSLTAATTKIDGITASLATLATAVGTKASAADVTKAVADVTANIKAELTAQLKTVNASITAAQAAMVASNDAQTIANNKAIVDSNTAQSAALTAAIGAIGTQLIALNAGTAVTDAQLQASVNALALLVTGQKAILDQLLANSNMYTGDVTITSIPEMRFFYGKISQIGIVSGNVVINTTNLTTKLDTVNLISSKIASVIGTGKNVTITTVAGTTLDLSKLVNISGAYSVSGVDVSDDNLTTVGGAVTLSYAGAYNLPNLTSVGGTLTLFNVLSATTPFPSLITSINVPNATATGLSDGGTVGIVSYPKATSIVIGGGVTIAPSLTAAIATTITLGTTSISGLTISAILCTTLNIASATTASGTSITTAAGCALDLTKVATSALGLTVTGPTTLSLPAMTSAAGGLTSSTATTVSLPLHAWAVPATLSAVTSLTLGKVANLVAAGNYPTLTTLAVTGTPSVTFATLLGSVTTTASNTVLASVTLGGNLSSAVITGCAKLTSLTTAGVINSLTIDTNAILAGVTLAHTHLVGATGSELIVTNNVKLLALNSGVLDYPKTITVTGNTLLASLTLSSYVTKLNEIAGSMTTITIGTNVLAGAYTKAVAATPTTSYVETTITSADLHTLKAFVASYKAAYITLSVNLDAVKIGTGTAATLAVQMDADSANVAIVGAATGINTLAEFALVQ